jgi:ABC-type Na+ efflux pump permease subunit
MTTRIVLIARNAFRGIMSRRALYIWAAAILLMFFRAAPQIIAGFRGPERMRAFMFSGAVAGSLDVWALLCLAAAILLGAGSIATERTTRTIVAVLARPVRRWELLVGKWLGVSAFAIATLLIGVVLAFGLGRYVGVDVDQVILVTLREALAQSIVAIILYSGVAVVLGCFGSWVIAGGVTVLLAFSPILVNELKRIDESPTWQRVGVTLDWITPDGYVSHYARLNKVPFPGATQRAPSPPPASAVPQQEDTRDLHRLLYANLSYAALYFLAGCAAFSRRNINLASG